MVGVYNPNGEISTSDESAVDVVTVTPSDSHLYVPALRGLYVGTSGDISITSPAGNTVTFVSVPAGFILPVYCSLVLDTDTTATDIVGLI